MLIIMIILGIIGIPAFIALFLLITAIIDESKESDDFYQD